MTLPTTDTPDNSLATEATALVKGTPEYDAAMIAKYDAAHTPPSDTPEEAPTEITPMPEGGQEKFYNKETGAYDWPSHAKDAEYRLTQSKKPTTPETPKAGDPPPVDADADAAAQALDDKGLDLKSFEAEFAEKGELTAESYEKLAKVGFSRDYVDTYIEGRAAIAERVVAEIHAVAGSADDYARMTEWAKATLPKEEVAAYNEAVINGNRNIAKLAAEGLKAKYVAANGREASLTTAQAGPKVSSGYTTREQMTSDMRDPRYKSDPAFRAQVAQKVAASGNLVSATHYGSFA